MGMGTAPNCCDGLTLENFHKLDMQAFTDFWNQLMYVGMSFDDFAQCENSDEWSLFYDEDVTQDELDKLIEKWRNLQAAFASKFPGLSLEVMYIEYKNGDRYDDVHESFFAIYGIYSLSRGGEQLSATLEDAVNFHIKWTQYG